MEGLYSTENKPDTSAIILLTYVAGGVKTHSFFDSFPSSSVGKMPLQNARKRVKKNPATSLRKLDDHAVHGQCRLSYRGTARKMAAENEENVKGETESRSVERLFR